MAASTAGIRLGAPSAPAGAGTAAEVLIQAREAPRRLLRGLSLSVPPLVAALFVLLAGLRQAGALASLPHLLRGLGGRSGAAAGDTLLALPCNATNNLPASLVSGSAIGSADPPPSVVAAPLIAVDLGPNLSVTGSLATILWLAALRREDVGIGFETFPACGALAMPVALGLALAALLLGQERSVGAP